MISSIAYSPSVFFDRNPSGRVLNRFSSDMAMLDVTIMMSLGHLFNGSIAMLNIYIYSFVLHWANGVIGIVLAIVLYILVLYFLNSLTLVKTFNNVSRSPVYSLLNNTIYGLIPIRTY